MAPAFVRCRMVRSQGGKGGGRASCTQPPSEGCPMRLLSNPTSPWELLETQSRSWRVWLRRRPHTACLCLAAPPLRLGGVLTAALAQTGSAVECVQPCRVARRPKAGTAGRTAAQTVPMRMRRPSDRLELSARRCTLCRPLISRCPCYKARLCSLARPSWPALRCPAAAGNSADRQAATGQRDCACRQWQHLPLQ